MVILATEHLYEHDDENRFIPIERLQDRVSYLTKLQ